MDKKPTRRNGQFSAWSAMSSRKALTALVVGCGSIGALKPSAYDQRFGQGNILTHAHAYRISPDIQLAGVVDTCEEKAREAAKKWDTGWDVNLQTAINDLTPDIVSVCVPTEHHYETLRQILRVKERPRLVIAEKPFCTGLLEAQRIAKLYREEGIPILINYTRRFSLDYATIQRRLAGGELGEVYHVRLLYGRGLMRDGCHGLDLFNWMLGPLRGIMVFGHIMDYRVDDPTMSLMMYYQRCRHVWMAGVDSRAYGIFEMEIIAERERIVFGSNGTWLHTSVPKEEQVYGNYRSMPGNPNDMRKTDLTNALSRMVANAAGHLLRKEILLCTTDDAVAVHRIIHSIRQVPLVERRLIGENLWN